ncbi:hypothetical protein M5X00_17635 [Paenibacillus alvei]|uniref:hypothetical protein n=1 Tax=Paenibacillus alvei TaxID=44250 RepID=UPI000289731D|nr:hypothetical protein [Paenibacillus alvei]EJW16920.1 hypothetical protein PAV_5c05030 [Paenibacillus alvei DSM 29]EJW19917.1 hypothetical protein PAV_1c09050 [Paenibacillus alvei DSM 29]MCY9543262.1 hypothetical protein [Paenibacillus alvei]MCY9708481.1 hypothetical protein [Paenibacillus alvei]MCY9732204.1 hypothetical protein [Paenibacillus alvei]
MGTVELKDLKPGSYVAVNGEITTKERVEQLIESGFRPSSLYTVSEAFIKDALDALHRDRMAVREPEDYCAPDQHAKRIIY